MKLIKRMEGNFTTSGKYEEHATSVWHLLSTLSRANARVARVRAVKEHAENDG